MTAQNATTHSDSFAGMAVYNTTTPSDSLKEAMIVYNTATPSVSLKGTTTVYNTTTPSDSSHNTQ